MAFIDTTKPIRLNAYDYVKIQGLLADQIVEHSGEIGNTHMTVKNEYGYTVKFIYDKTLDE